jgi:porin
MRRLILQISLFIAIGAMLFSATGAAQAVEPDDTAATKAWIDNPYGATGDWGGHRTTLHDAGVDIAGDYLVELASNVDGGRERGTAYAHQINAALSMDMSKLTAWHGATVHLEFVYRDGENLSSSRIGNLFQVQETFGGGRIARLAELSIEQSLAGGRINIRAGRVFAGSDFGASPLFCAFQTNAICGHPNSIPYNTGISLYPVGSWGGRIEIRPNARTYVRTGVYEVNPSLNDKNGFDWSLNGATGVFVPAEVGVQIGSAAGHNTGMIRVGVYYDSSNTSDNFRDIKGGSRALSGLAPLKRSGRYGGYVLLEKKITSGKDNPDRGLMIFGGVTFSDPETAYFGSFTMAGLVKTGTFKGRDSDTVALGVAYGRVSNRIMAFERDEEKIGRQMDIQRGEAVIEFNYGYQIGPWLHVRPNIQYIIQPGALRSLKNATVIGLQTVIGF